MQTEKANQRVFHDSYRTSDEIAFINGLGTFGIRPSEKSKKELLRLYIKSAQKRNDWASIDKDAVIKHAKSLL